jgi:hypothetical protein
MKNRNDYVITKSNPTLTQSGMLALLLQRQRGKVIELARRRAHWEHVRAVFGSTLNWLLARSHAAIAGRLFRRDFGGNVPWHT